MLEARIAPAEQLADQKTAMLQGVEIDPLLASSLTFDPSLAALIQPSDDESFRMLVFRTHTPTEQSAVLPTDLVNKEPSAQQASNSLYGTGLYVGNSAASVAMFQTTRPGTKIGAFLTAPVFRSEILDARTNDNARTFAKKLLGKRALIKSGQSDLLISQLDDAYGDSKVVVLNKGLNTIIGQNVWVKDNTYPVQPNWYLIRDAAIQLERVGFAGDVEPRPAIRLLKTMLEKHDARK